MSSEDSEGGLAHSGHWMSTNWYYYPGYGELKSLVILTRRVTSFLTLTQSSHQSHVLGDASPWISSTSDLQEGCHKDPSLPRVHDVQEHSEQAGGSHLAYPHALKPLDFNA